MFLGAASCMSYFSPLLTLSLFSAANRGPVQFSSIPQSCPTLCDLMDCSTAGLPLHHQLPELAQTHVDRVGDGCHPTISSFVVPFSSCLQSLPASESSTITQFFVSGGQSIGVSGSASVLPMNIQN